jgi:hypothetical protein
MKLLYQNNTTTDITGPPHTSENKNVYSQPRADSDIHVIFTAAGNCIQAQIADNKSSDMGNL